MYNVLHLYCVRLNNQNRLLVADHQINMTGLIENSSSVSSFLLLQLSQLYSLYNKDIATCNDCKRCAHFAAPSFFSIRWQHWFHRENFRDISKQLQSAPLDGSRGCIERIFDWKCDALEYQTRKSLPFLQLDWKPTAKWERIQSIEFLYT